MGKTWMHYLLMAFLALACVFFYYPDWILNLDTHFLGERDVNIYLFNAANLELQIERGLPVFETSSILHPFQPSILVHTHTLAMSVFALGFDTLVLGVNLFLILHFLLSFLGGTLLANHFLKNLWFALVCGLVFAFSPYKTLRLTEHYNLVLTGFLPWFILAFEKGFDLKDFRYIPKFVRWKYLFGMMGFFTLSLMGSYVVSFIALMYIPARIFGVHLSRIQWRKRPLVYMSIGIVALLGIDQLSQFLNREGFDRLLAFYWTPDMMWMFIPNHLALYQGEFFEFRDALYGYSLGMESHAFLSYSLIGLFILSAFLPVEKSNRNLALGITVLIVLLLCFPVIRILGIRMLNGPTSLLHFLPIFEQMRNPIRYMTLFPFLLAVWALRRVLVQEKYAFLKKPFFPVALFLIFLIEFKPIRPMLRAYAEVPSEVGKLGDLEYGALLELPFWVSSGDMAFGKIDKNQLRLVDVHRKALVGGHLSRLPDQVFEYYTSNRFLKKLVALELDRELKEEFSDEALRTDFQKLNLDYIHIPSAYRNSPAHHFIQEIMNGGYSLVVETQGCVYQKGSN